jgi:hypothetical protein
MAANQTISSWRVIGGAVAGAYVFTKYIFLPSCKNLIPGLPEVPFPAIEFL